MTGGSFYDNPFGRAIDATNEWMSEAFLITILKMKGKTLELLSANFGQIKLLMGQVTC